MFIHVNSRKIRENDHHLKGSAVNAYCSKHILGGGHILVPKEKNFVDFIPSRLAKTASLESQFSTKGN